MSQLANTVTVGEATRQEDLSGPPAANRHRLPDERAGITHHFSIAGHEGYVTVGLYPNGQPGELFIRMAKEGSTIAGLMECFGTVVSVSLQHGVPLRVLCDKLSHTRFEPSGWTGHPAWLQQRRGLSAIRQPPENGVPEGTQPLFQGNAVTGSSYSTGKPFDVGRQSDFDIALAGSDLFEKAKALNLKAKDGTRIGPLSAKKLGGSWTFGSAGSIEQPRWTLCRVHAV